jgi:hypothetical protein
MEIRTVNAMPQDGPIARQFAANVKAATEQQMIPLALPSVTDDEIAAAAAVLESGWWTTGPEGRRVREASSRPPAGRGASQWPSRAPPSG